MEDEFTDVKQRLLHILEEAIEQEHLSQRRYALGASLATDPAVKEMFVRLVEDEMGHERTLREGAWLCWNRKNVDRLPDSTRQPSP